MKALYLTTIIYCVVSLMTINIADARPVNPTGTVSESSLTPTPNTPTAKTSQWDKVKNTVTNWYDKAKTSFFGDSPKATKKAPKAVVKKAPPKPDPVKELTAQLPDYKTEDKGVSQSDIDSASRQISEGATRVAAPGRAADPSLPTNKLGIPQVDATDKKQVKGKKGKTKTIRIAKKKIPLLNVGLEDTLELNEFMLPNFTPAKVPEKTAKALKTPKVLSKKDLEKALKKFPVKKIAEAKDPRKEAKLKSELVTQKMIDAIQLVMDPDKPVNEMDYQEFSKTDIKMLAAVILNQGWKNCEAVMGLFYELRKEADKKKESDFHIGACAAKLKLHTTAFKYLGRLIREENTTYAERALDLLSDDLPRDLEPEFAKMILKLKNKAIITQKVQDAVYYRVAKGSYDNRKFKQAKNYASKVSEKSKFGMDALYVSAVSDYALGRKTSAAKQLEKLIAKAKVDKDKNKEIMSLASINLGRIKFTQEKFDQALVHFKAVHKNTSLWVRALVEQGWAQLMMGDAPGAIGNMYSLHSPYFTAVYKPESYVVRTIGYLNICQYGDAYKTLSLLETDYRPWRDAVTSYIKRNPASKNYYHTVKRYLTGKSSANVDGLPYQVIREMARQKGFLNAQGAINEKFDEKQRYEGVYAGIRKKKANYKWRRGKARERLNKAKALIRQSKTDNSLAPQLNTLKAQVRNESRLITGYDYLIKLMDESRRSYKTLYRVDNKVLAKYKKNLEAKAGKSLVSHLKKLKVDMARMLSNNEFLRYEVFAGSGQNIRYQVAGGNTANTQRIPASIKPEKSLNWSFSGEYWEDEIGAYRSSLKNNCPQMGHYNTLKKDSNI